MIELVIEKNSFAISRVFLVSFANRPPVNCKAHKHVSHMTHKQIFHFDIL